MGRKPISNQLLRAILRLRSQGKAFRAIAAICGVGRTTAQDYYRLAKSKGLDWNDVKHHSNAKLKTELQSAKLKPSAYDEPDFDRYSKLLYLKRIRGIDDAYNYYCEEDGDGKKYSRASFGDSNNGVGRAAKKTRLFLVISGLPGIAVKSTTVAIPCISTFRLINIVLKRDRFRSL